MPPTESKSYDPALTEQRIFKFWEDGGFFRAQPDDRPREKRFCMVIPPPNVTGALHLGHALNNTLQDILVRHKRMAGYNTFWLVGTDHAGIATQAVVEKTIRKDEGKSRHDLGREELVRRIWEWKEKYGGRIVEQLKLMGCSCDYSRERFTLDEGCAKAVRETFFKLFRDGLIYRGKRLVNWDTQLQTAVADDEVYHEAVKGHFYTFKYPIIASSPGGATDNSPGHQPWEMHASNRAAPEGRKNAPSNINAGEPTHVHIATTRPETMLADTAVAVHPDPAGAMDKADKEAHAKLAESAEKEKAEIQARIDDIAERKRSLLPTLLKLRDMAQAGRKVMLPLVNREIPLICDEWADPTLGTGCVKITPAHDANDYDVGRRHELPMINVMTPDGRVNENGGAYKDMKFAEARKGVVEDLEKLGLVEKIEDRVIDLGHSDRSKTPIEPYLSDQWFVRMGDLEPEHAAKIDGLRLRAPGLAQMAINAVKSGAVKFHPARYENTYVDWLSEKRDWCISRQLWWGHRIPVWTSMLTDNAGGRKEDSAGGSESRNLSATSALLSEYFREAGVADSIAIRPEQNETSTWLAISAATQRAEDAIEAINVAYSPETFREIEVPFKGTTLRIERPSQESYRAALKKALERVQLSWCAASSAALDRLTEIAECHEAPYSQDDDVLDTWFSSALWPHSTLGWPDAGVSNPQSEIRNPQSPHTGETPMLPYYYPTNVLSTAREIITLWVARMVITGLYNMGDVPFSDVVIHSVIQDGQGRKMSKTAGNGVDPVDIIEEYGADALRFTLADLSTETQDIRLPVRPKKLPDGRTINISEKFEKGRNFCNKLWQAATGFVMRNLDGYAPRPIDPATLRLEDRWILSRMTAAQADLDAALANYRFSEAADIVYRFMWDEYCSWYIEMVKSRVASAVSADGAANRPIVGNSERSTAQQVLVFVLDQLLRMLHPFVPFVTEAIWAELKNVAPRRGLNEILDAEHALVAAAWPKRDDRLRNSDIEAQMECLQALISSIRDIRAEVNDHRGKAKQPSVRNLATIAVRADAGTCQLIEEYRAFVMPLAGCASLEAGAQIAKPHHAMTRMSGNMEIYAPVADYVDLDEVRRAEAAKLEELRRLLQREQGKIANEDFVKRADPVVVAQSRQRAAELSSQISVIENHLAEMD